MSFGFTRRSDDAFLLLAQLFVGPLLLLLGHFVEPSGFAQCLTALDEGSAMPANLRVAQHVSNGSIDCPDPPFVDQPRRRF